MNLVLRQFGLFVPVEPSVDAKYHSLFEDVVNILTDTLTGMQRKIAEVHKDPNLNPFGKKNAIMSLGAAAGTAINNLSTQRHRFLDSELRKAQANVKVPTWREQAAARGLSDTVWEQRMREIRDVLAGMNRVDAQAAVLAASAKPGGLDVVIAYESDPAWSIRASSDDAAVMKQAKAQWLQTTSPTETEDLQTIELAIAYFDQQINMALKFCESETGSPVYSDTGSPLKVA